MELFDNIMGVREASEISGYSLAYIKDSCANGKIKAIKIGTNWIIDKRLFNWKKH